jgi:CRP-like cAMP-binding protein
MGDSPQQLPTRSLANRVAVPVAPPVLTPSLIPWDVLQAYEAEVKQVESESARSATNPIAPSAVEPAPSVENVGFLSETPADPAVAQLALSQVRLFAGLPSGSLGALAKGAVQLEVPDHHLLFVEGVEADSFYVVVEGTVEIFKKKEEREVALRHIGRGESIGLFGLFSAALRAASARAIGDCVLLRLPCKQLQKLVDGDPALHDRLLRFHQERLLEGFVGSSKLFTDIDNIARARLIGSFKEKALLAGETLMNPGEVGNLMAVVTHGALVLDERSGAGGAPRQFEVTPGQYLVVSSALSGVPARLKVHALRATTVVMLGHRELTTMLKDYPALRNLPVRLQHQARALDRDVFCGHTGVPGL